MGSDGAREGTRGAYPVWARFRARTAGVLAKIVGELYTSQTQALPMVESGLVLGEVLKFAAAFFGKWERWVSGAGSFALGYYGLSLTPSWQRVTYLVLAFVAMLLATFDLSRDQRAKFERERRVWETERKVLARRMSAYRGLLKTSQSREAQKRDARSRIPEIALIGIDLPARKLIARIGLAGEATATPETKSDRGHCRVPRLLGRALVAARRVLQGRAPGVGQGLRDRPDHRGDFFFSASPALTARSRRRAWAFLPDGGGFTLSKASMALSNSSGNSCGGKRGARDMGSEMPSRPSLRRAISGRTDPRSEAGPELTKTPASKAASNSGRRDAEHRLRHSIDPVNPLS